MTGEERAKRIAEIRGRERALSHAIQTGVKVSMENEMPAHVSMRSGNIPEFERLADELLRRAKHLRTGIDTAHAAVAALADVLEAKGILDPIEYGEALLVRLDREVKTYEKELSDLLGRPVTLR